MWNSLWSIYDGTADDGPPSKTTATPRSAPSTPRIVSTSNPNRIVGESASYTPRARANSSAAVATARGVEDNRRPVTLQTSLHSASSSLDNSNKSRNRQAAAAVSSTKPIILRGIIVGEEQSGKTCLIRRLRGEDPFLQTGHGKTVQRQQRNLMALLPWKIQEAPFQQQHHALEDSDPVQLYISEGKSFCYKEKSFQKQWTSVLHPGQRGNNTCLDFVVWMIDPRMDHALDFFREGLDSLLCHLPAEVVVADNEQDDNDEDTKQPSVLERSHKKPLLQNLCVLLNFRDVKDATATPQNDSKASSLLGQMQHAAEQAMDRHQSSATGTTKFPTPTILVYESSMTNCYGLQNLHSFITLPYLAHKERELVRRAELTRKQRSQWKQGLAENNVVVGYADFVEQMLPKESNQPLHTSVQSSLERQRLEEEMEQLQLRVKQQNQMLRSKAQKQDTLEKNDVPVSKQRDSRANSSTTPSAADRPKEGGKQSDAPDSENGHASPRKLFATKARHRNPSVQKALPPSAITDHNNLESFFSDDEDDEQAESGTNDLEHDYSDTSYDDDDSEDDGDFYFDVSGNRRSHANKPPARNALPKHESTQIRKSSEASVAEEVGVTTVTKVEKVDAPVENPASTEEKEDDNINDANSDHGGTSISVDAAVQKLEDHAEDDSNQNAFRRATCPPNESYEPYCVPGTTEADHNTRSPNKPTVEEEGEDHNIDTNSELDKASASNDNEAKKEVDDQTAESDAENIISENDDVTPGDEYCTRSVSDPAEAVTNTDGSADAAADAEVLAEDSSRETFMNNDTKATTSSDYEAKTEVGGCSVNDPISTDSESKADHNNSSSLAVSSDISKKEDTNNENTVSENGEDASSNETRTKGARDGLCDSTNAQSEGAGIKPKTDHEEQTSSEGGANLTAGVAAAKTDKIKHQKRSNEIVQSHFVMDSDDESTGLREGRSAKDDAGRSGEEETVGNSLPTPLSPESISPQPSLPKQAPIPVSSAALAAIDTARREVEQMMAQSQSKTTSSTKREKRSKKKKDGKKKKNDKRKD